MTSAGPIPRPLVEGAIQRSVVDAAAAYSARLAALWAATLSAAATVPSGTDDGAEGAGVASSAVNRDPSGVAHA